MNGSHKSQRSIRLAMEAAAWFFDNTLDLFMVVRDGLIERASPSVTNFLGWPEAEAIGRPFWDFVHPRDQALVRAGVAEATRTGQAIYEHRVSTKSGNWLWVRVRIKKSEDGAAIVVMQDITAERRRLQEAAEAGSAYRLLSASSGVRLWRYHPENDECEFDPDFSTPFLHTAAERRTPAATFRGLVHREDWPVVEAAWNASTANGKMAVVEYREQLEGGDWRHMRVAWMGVRQHAGIGWEIVGVSQDLTELMAERDRALRGEEAAQSASRAKAEFLANISHELRTPMNGVLGTLHLLKIAHSEDERQRLIDEGVNAGSDLARLLSDIVDYADADAGRVRIQDEPVDLGAFVRELTDPLAERAGEKGLGLMVDCALEGFAETDPVRLRQILSCLLENAVKFTPSGHIAVRARHRQAEDRKILEFEVQDTGVGIPADKQQALFETFHQADGSTTRRFGGAGLGLARARKLAELMGGTIEFTSEEGEGSTFRLTIAVAACSGPSTGDVLQGLRVLVVEDNPTNRLVATKLLEGLGAAVWCAENGAIGVETAAKGGFDLIFMDIQMPVMDGVEATRRIRRLEGEAAHTPILAMTANVLEHQVRLYAECGMNGCVAKPVSPAALIAEIARLSEGGEDAAAQTAA